ncbi:MAG: hypothetical protein KGV50_00410 [Gammaproteobacteria bacterium]|nr:hypothetical protein [Gammaproteobacteria bacterium]
MILHKCGFTPQQVLDLAHYEVSWWIDSYLISIGAKKQTLIPAASEERKQQIRQQIAAEKAQQARQSQQAQQ